MSGNNIGVINPIESSKKYSCLIDCHNRILHLYYNGCTIYYCDCARRITAGVRKFFQTTLLFGEWPGEIMVYSSAKQISIDRLSPGPEFFSKSSLQLLNLSGDPVLRRSENRQGRRPQVRCNIQHS